MHDAVRQSFPSRSKNAHRTIKNVPQLSSFLSSIDSFNYELHKTSELNVCDLSYQSSYTPEQIAMKRELISYIREKMNELTDSQRQLVELRYFQGCNLDEIREFFGGVSRSWISRLNTKALDRLRTFFIRDAKHARRVLAYTEANA